MTIALATLAAFLAAASLVPLIRTDDWWIRVFDFPRLQIFILALITLAGFFVFSDANSWPRLLVPGLLILGLLVQACRIAPYTPLYPKEVLDTAALGNSAGTPLATISVIIANVLMSNRDAGRLLKIIDAHRPDVILALEPDHWWEEQLQPLEERYRHTVKEPLDNRYGMLLYSRLELLEPEIKHLISDGIPSMHARVRLATGELIGLHCLHPEPPSPTEADASTPRDAELLIVGREVKDSDVPTIVTGDMNDVAWSHTTSLFQKISGLLDPRKGRGMYNTFHAKYPFMRWPLDHVFHSDHFTLDQLERLSAFGSDHFPVYVRLTLRPGATSMQKGLSADANDREEADETIDAVDQQEQM